MENITITPQVRKDLIIEMKREAKPSRRLRMHIALLASDGRSPTEIARVLFCSRTTVYAVVSRFVGEGRAAFDDRRPLPASPPGAYPEPAGVLHCPSTLGEPSRPSIEGPQACAVLREASTLEELACGFIDRGDGYPDALWGSTPMSTFMSARTSVSVGPLSHRRERRTFRLRAVHTPLLSHSARRGHRRDASREQTNPPEGRQEVREPSPKPVP